jgi:hypothetical protein
VPSLVGNLPSVGIVAGRCSSGPEVGAARRRCQDGAIDLTADLEAPCPPEALFAQVEDLGRYPPWFAVVRRAEPDPPRQGDPGPAWQVDLRARLGPLARSKRLRMVRAGHQPPTAVRFERRELDGRVHSPWVLEATVAPAPAGSRLEVHLHYGGGLFGPVLERLLIDEVERAKPRLLALVSG